ncbi:hypothetical protein PR048_023935 [Dryococelus australis]|uniref:Uncharacterized protein n=1 Tax=Dryococelus australis TaxID=614101 RepID=A0ABQ9GVH4_9NEOP|nr:hypothetical protein PR048_023935 [Dryococelus australis]
MLFGEEVWCKAAQFRIQRLQVVQNKILRAIPNASTPRRIEDVHEIAAIQQVIVDVILTALLGRQTSAACSCTSHARLCVKCMGPDVINVERVNDSSCDLNDPPHQESTNAYVCIVVNCCDPPKAESKINIG